MISDPRLRDVDAKLSVDNVKVDDNFFVCRDELAVGNSSHVEQLLAGNRLGLVGVFVRKINDLKWRQKYVEKLVSKIIPLIVCHSPAWYYSEKCE